MTKLTSPRISRFPLPGGAVLFKYGREGYVFDQNDRNYIDFVCGFGPVVLGHAHPPEFLSRLQGMLANGMMMPGYTVFHEEYASKLLASRPSQKAAFFKTGSESVTAALRIAALATRRKGVIRGGFVGWHDAQIGRSLLWHEPLNSPFRNQERYTAGIRGIGQGERVFNWIDLEPTSLRKLLRQHKIAAFVFDAYLLSHTTKEVIKEAVSACRKAGTIVIMDETKTGGRASRLGVADSCGIDCDLTVIGKSLANGAPLSLVVGRSSLLKIAEDNRLSGTYSKEMLAVYAASATFDIMESGAGYARLKAVGQQVVEAINNAAAATKTSEHVQAKSIFEGCMFQLDYSEHILGNWELREGLQSRFARNGVLMLGGHPSFVCLAHETLDWVALEAAFAKALASWRRSL